MADEATTTSGGGNADDGRAVSEPSVAAIVDELGENTPWSSGDTRETPHPASGSETSDEADAGKGKPAKTDAPEATRSEAKPPEYFSEEQLGKLTLREIANPSFDWSKVPPSWTNALKGWQAAETRAQQLAAERRRSPDERKRSTPQPAEAKDPQEETNRQIVADSLKALGIDPEVIAEMGEDAVRTKGIALAVQTIPEYLSSETFNEAVNVAIVADPRLSALADSGDPEDIALAIQTAAYRVQRDGLAGQLKGFQDREAAITAKEKELADEKRAVEQERAKLNRSRASVAGGASQGERGTPPKKDSDKSMNEIVDELGFFDRAPSLRVG
jgi:hypothetical protein